MSSERPVSQYFEANFRPKRQYVPDKRRDWVIGIIDDEHGIVRGLQDGFNDRGFDTVGFYADPDVQVPEFYIGALADYLVGFGIHIALCDKGLGYTSGIETVKALNERGVLTVMITGERETRETHRVAHKYVEKGQSTDLFYAAVNGLIGIEE